MSCQEKERVEDLGAADPPRGDWIRELSRSQPALRCTPSPVLWSPDPWAFTPKAPSLTVPPYSTALCEGLIAPALEWLPFKSQDLLTTWMSSWVTIIQGFCRHQGRVIPSWSDKWVFTFASSLLTGGMNSSRDIPDLCPCGIPLLPIHCVWDKVSLVALVKWSDTF